MKFEHCVKVYDCHGEWLGMLEPQDECGGRPIAWCFVAQDNTLSQDEVEAIAVKLRELNEAAKPGGRMMNKTYRNRKKLGCPICGGIEAKSCLRCMGKTRICDWVKTNIGWVWVPPREAPEVDY